MNFKLHSEYKPTGDQPQAIEKLVRGIIEKKKHQTLLGVTGSGKTFTMANIIEKVGFYFLRLKIITLWPFFAYVLKSGWKRKKKYN